MLSYTGNVLEVWAQITFHGIGGGSIDETFNILEEPGSDTREAVWLMSRHGTATIALGNTSSVAIHTRAQFADGESEDFEIPAGVTRFVRHHARGGSDDDMTSESVKLITSGPEGSLRVAGFIVNDDDTFPSSIRFYDTKMTVQPNLYAVNFRLKNATPRIVLKNTADSEILVQPRFLSAAGEQASPVELQSLTLKPQQIADVDLSALRQAGASRTDLDSVSVQILNSGAPGSLIGAAYSTERATRLTYDVPLRDSGKVRNATGSYPWRVDDDYSTTVVITNVGNQPARFQVELRYPGGPYSIKQKELAVGEAASFDLRQIRDQQQPDRTGKTLPPALEHGQFHWSMVATPGEARIVGRAEVVSRSGQVASSYSCTSCCPDSGPYSHFDPNAYALYVNGFAFTNGVGDYHDCYNNHYFGSFSWSSMWTYNTSIATVTGSAGQLNGIDVGNTSVAIQYQFFEWYLDRGNCYYYQGSAGDSAPVKVGPTITGPHSVWWFNGESPSGYSTQIALSTSSIGNSYHWAVVSGTSKVSLSGDGTNEVTITSSGKSDSANDVGIQVSVDGQVSDQFNITVFAPNDLLQGTVTHLSDSTWGYTTHINYYIRDQFTTQLPSGVPVNEQWTTGVVSDFSGMNWGRNNPHGFSASIAAFSDLIQGEESGRTPTPTSPGSPPGMAVYHWGQDWYIGSTTPGSGRRVQSDTLQKYTDHGEHQNIVTPNP